MFLLKLHFLQYVTSALESGDHNEEEVTDDEKENIDVGDCISHRERSVKFSHNHKTATQANRLHLQQTGNYIFN